jgi:CheY-like chemotaxis protein
MPLEDIEKYTTDRRRFVLVVDNNDRNRQFLFTLLKRFEYDAFAVKTVKEAQEIASVISPVLIVSARQLDEGNDALELISSIKSANPAGTTPLIVMTTRPDPAFERACLNAGALTCLRAPVSFENFYRVIQVAIEPIPRMTIRISTDLPALINDTRKDERVQDISENGAYILASTLHPRNTRLSVRIKLPDRVISVDAVVIYVKQSDRNGQSGMGLSFEQISPEDQQRIRLFIRSEMSKVIDPSRAAEK